MVTMVIIKCAVAQ